MKRRKLIISLSVVFLVGCECEIEYSKYTTMENNLDTDISVEYRYFSGESQSYIYQLQDIRPNHSTGFKIESEKRDKNGFACIGATHRVVDTNTAAVQFSLATLAQYTVCDAIGFKNEFGGIVPRYQFYSLGSDCGDYRLIDISEGY